MNSLKIAEDGVEGLGFAIPSKTLCRLLMKLWKKVKWNGHTLE